MAAWPGIIANSHLLGELTSWQPCVCVFLFFAGVGAVPQRIGLTPLTYGLV